jgi:molybdopterin-dependent oxidoreductase alpha subunit
MKAPRSGGGWKAIGYSLKLAQRVGWWKMWKAMRSRNTCKTCAVGMGGQLGGMVNEGGYFPEVCKKSFQAMASDMQGGMRREFIEQTSISQLRAMTPRQLELSGRITTPMVLEKGQNAYRAVTWSEAMQRVCAALKAAGPQRSFFYASGRSSSEAGFLLQLLSRLFGTNYVNNCSYYCHQASGVGLGMSIGTGAGTVRLEDLDHADLMLLIGANPSSNHPRLMRSLVHLRRRGGRIIVVNPMKELGLTSFRVPSDARSLLFGSEIASTYVQPHIGGDLALLTGIAKEVLEKHAQDDGFIQQHTEHFEEFRDQIQRTSWENITEQSGVSRDTIRDLAAQYLNSKNVIIAWCMGITHHLHGTRSVLSIANLALLRGMVGRSHAGLMPIRGHSNVQGLGSVGVTPALKQAMLQKFEQRLGVQLPTSPGYDTMACMQAAHRGEMDFALCLGGNLYGSNPDSRFALDAMQRLKTIVYMSTTLNTTHAWGTGQETLILPVLPRDEETQPTTQESMFSYVRRSDGGVFRFESPRSEVSLLAEIGQSVLTDSCGLNWKDMQSHAAVRLLMSELIPGYEQVSEMDQGGKEFHVPGRAVVDYQFPHRQAKQNSTLLSCRICSVHRNSSD